MPGAFGCDFVLCFLFFLFIELINVIDLVPAINIYLVIRFLVFVLRGFIFSILMGRRKHKKILNFIPLLQFYFFTKILISEKDKELDVRISIIVSYIYKYIVSFMFTLCFYISRLFTIYSLIFLFLTWIIIKFIFNIAYFKVFIAILDDVGVKSRFILNLIQFSILFFSEILVLFVVLYQYKKYEKLEKA